MNLLNKTNELTDFYVKINFYIKISNKNHGTWQFSYRSRERNDRCF